MPEITTDPATHAKSKSAKLAFGAVPKAKNQLDNDCGIYALYIGLCSRAEATQGAAPIPPRARRADKSAPKAPNSSIRQVAVANGYSKVGELFDAGQVVSLARDLHASADLKSIADEGGFFSEIKQAIDGNRTVMVPYSNNSGNPKFDGKNAHWCLVFGYWEDGDKVPYVLATHWGKYWEWKSADLAKSNASINDWEEKVYEKTGPHDWNPASGAATKNETRVIPAVPLSKTLARKIVLL